MYLREEGKQVTKGSDILEQDDPATGEPYIGKDFRYNPGLQILPNDSSYAEILSSANKLDVNDFSEELTTSQLLEDGDKHRKPLKQQKNKIVFENYED